MLRRGISISGSSISYGSRLQTSDNRLWMVVNMRDYRNIKAWQYADSLVVDIYEKTKLFPKEELYGLTSQLRRAAVSVATNIAEGASREHRREYLQFLYIARGSINETKYLVHLGKKLGYINKRDYETLHGLSEEASKTLHGLITSVKKEASLVSKIPSL